MTLDELREQERQARKRLGVGCENPDEWDIETFDADGQVEAEHVVDGIDAVLALDGLSVSLNPGYRESATLRGFIPAAILRRMMTELRSAIGPTAFEEIYGVTDGN